MLSTLGLLPLLGLKGQAGAGMMEELRKWKPVLVELQPQPEHSSKAAMERRKGYLDLSSLPPLTLQPLAGASHCPNQLEARGQESLGNAVYLDPSPGTKTRVEKCGK